MKVFAALLLATPLLATDDVCPGIASCEKCIVGNNCGWCPSLWENQSTLQPTSYHCGNIKDTGIRCQYGYLTSGCTPGWVCSPTYGQCVPAQPGVGNPSKGACQASCSPAPPGYKCMKDATPYQCVACIAGEEGCITDYTECMTKECVDHTQYKCDKTSGKCMKCADGETGCTDAGLCDDSCKISYACHFPGLKPDKSGAGPQCVTADKASPADKKYDSNTSCTAECKWQWACSAETNYTCAEYQYGATKKEWCHPCKPPSAGFECVADLKAGNGSCVAANSSSGYTNKSQCETSCPPIPTNSTPYEIRNISRGFAMQQGFVKGEWDANVTEKTIMITNKDGLYFYGEGLKTWNPASKSQPYGTQLWATAKGGTLAPEGTLVKFIHGDSALHPLTTPEEQMWALAVDESAPGTPLDDFDTGMAAPKAKVFIFDKCVGGNCTFDKVYPGKTTEFLAAAASRSNLIGAQVEEIVEEAKLLSAEEIKGMADPCNTFTTCKACVGAHDSAESNDAYYCGFCEDGKVIDVTTGKDTGKVCYGFDQSTFKPFAAIQCQGLWLQHTCVAYKCDHSSGTCLEVDPTDPAAQDIDICKATCSGAHPYGKCPFPDTVYRGLEVSKKYQQGEWDMKISDNSSKLELVTEGFTLTMDITCKAVESSDREATGAMKATVETSTDPSIKKGDILYALYSMNGGSPEVSPLDLAWAGPKATEAPASFDEAMAGADGDMVTAFKYCNSYSKQCDFSSAVPTVSIKSAAEYARLA